jgi:hypothetical protein
LQLVNIVANNCAASGCDNFEMILLRSSSLTSLSSFSVILIAFVPCSSTKYIYKKVALLEIFLLGYSKKYNTKLLSAGNKSFVFGNESNFVLKANICLLGKC